MQATSGGGSPNAADVKRREFGVMLFFAIVVAGIVGIIINQVRSFEGAVLVSALLMLVFLTAMKLYELWQR